MVVSGHERDIGTYEDLEEAHRRERQRLLEIQERADAAIRASQEVTRNSQFAEQLTEEKSSHDLPPQQEHGTDEQRIAVQRRADDAIRTSQEFSRRNAEQIEEGRRVLETQQGSQNQH